MPDEPEVVILAATDPANPHGTTLKWPAFARAAGRPDVGESDAGRAPTRTVGALVVLVNGALAAYIPRGAREIGAYLPDDEPARSTTGRALARALATLARDEHRGLFIAEINGRDPALHPLAPFLIDAGFHSSPMGFQMRRPPHVATARQA